MPSNAPTTSSEPLRFLPSYNGSKARWIRRLEHLRGRNIVELFAGTAAISANYASRALLVEADPIVARILTRFDELEVPETFTRDDYYALRGQEDWWRHAFCLSAMAFSGLFRYTDAGFNATHKGGGPGKPSRDPQYDVMHLRARYEATLARWQELSPTIIHDTYQNVTDQQIAGVGEKPVVILDPPYEGAKTPYNKKFGAFDYDAYWARAEQLAQHFDVIIFDTAANLQRAGYPVHGTRGMTMNASRPAGTEAISFVTDGAKPTERLSELGFHL